MNKKRWILIILALLIWVTCACFLLPWKIWNDCQDKIDACVEAQKEWVKQICPTDCNHYEENFVVSVNSQEDEEVEDNKDDEEIKDHEIKKPEGKKFEENKRKEPETTETTETKKDNNSWITDPKTEEDCPEWKVLRCPMWICFKEGTMEGYPCQDRCFCVSPDMYF